MRRRQKYIVGTKAYKRHGLVPVKVHVPKNIRKTLKRIAKHHERSMEREIRLILTGYAEAQLQLEEKERKDREKDDSSR